MTFRIAIVQPITHRPPDDERNVADAVQAIERAAGRAPPAMAAAGTLQHVLSAATARSNCARSG